MSAEEGAGWYQIITAFPDALTTVGWLRESGEWFIPDPTFNEASVVGARLARLIPENEILEPTGVLYWQDAERELRATQSRLDEVWSMVQDAIDACHAPDKDYGDIEKILSGPLLPVTGETTDKLIGGEQDA